MSWDISIMRFDQEYTNLDDMPKNAQSLPLGDHVEIQQIISNHFPRTDWSDPNWGIFDSPYGSIEFNLGKTEPIMSFMLHVRASVEIIHPIIEMCLQNHWQAIDHTADEFLEKMQQPERGLVAWTQYRNKMLGNP